MYEDEKLMKDSVIEVRDFRKTYGDVVAVGNRGAHTLIAEANVVWEWRL